MNISGLRVALGSDHAGFELKSAIAAYLSEKNAVVIDVGTNSLEPVDYPKFCAEAARRVVQNEADFAIVFGGSGQGEAISANKVHGVRAALCQDIEIAHLAREHNNANVLSLGARIVAKERAYSIVDEFLTTEFAGGRHVPRLEQIAQIENDECQ